jgi:hypothetical protein
MSVSITLGEIADRGVCATGKRKELGSLPRKGGGYLG